MQEPARAFLSLGASERHATRSLARAGEAGWFEVSAWSLAISAAGDAASGLPTGKRQAEPMVATKEVDDTSPRLMTALVEQQVLPLLTLEVWHDTDRSERPSAADLLDKPGDEAVKIFKQRLEESQLEARCAYRVRLHDARVLTLETEMLDGEEIEHLTFGYRRVEWTWDPDGKPTTIEADGAGDPQAVHQGQAERVLPVLVEMPKTAYPAAARKLKKGAARVDLRLLVGEDGAVRRVERVSTASTGGFDRAAEAAARKSTWKPGTIDGEAAEMEVDLSVRFEP